MPVVLLCQSIKNLYCFLTNFIQVFFITSTVFVFFAKWTNRDEPVFRVFEICKIFWELFYLFIYFFLFHGLSFFISFLALLVVERRQRNYFAVCFCEYCGLSIFFRRIHQKFCLCNRSRILGFYFVILKLNLWKKRGYFLKKKRNFIWKYNIFCLIFTSWFLISSSSNFTLKATVI